MVCGFLSRYYGTLGIKKLYGFEIQEGSDSETTPTQPKTNLPQLEEQEQTLEGR